MIATIFEMTLGGKAVPVFNCTLQGKAVPVFNCSVQQKVRIVKVGKCVLQGKAVPVFNCSVSSLPPSLFPFPSLPVSWRLKIFPANISFPV